MVDAEAWESLIAAIRQTLRRAFHVSVWVRTAIPMMAEFAPGIADGVRWTGAADFLGDGARLILGAEELRFSGPRTFTLMRDGRWKLNEGEVGRFATLHPRYPLEAILQARDRVVVLGDGRFQVELDRDKLGALSDAGVSPDWRPLIEVVVIDGIVGNVKLELKGRAEPQTSIVIVFEYRQVDQLSVIDLPALTDTITAADWIR